MIGFSSTIERCTKRLDQNSRDHNTNISSEEDLPSWSIDRHLNIVVSRAVDPRHRKRENDSDEREGSGSPIGSSGRLNSIAIEVLSSSPSSHTPDDERRDPEVRVETMDPGDPEDADDPHRSTDEDHAGPLGKRPVGDGVETRCARDRIDGVPASGADHREDHDEEVAPVAEGVTRESRHPEACEAECCGPCREEASSEVDDYDDGEAVPE